MGYGHCTPLSSPPQRESAAFKRTTSFSSRGWIPFCASLFARVVRVLKPRSRKPRTSWRSRAWSTHHLTLHGPRPYNREHLAGTNDVSLCAPRPVSPRCREGSHSRRRPLQLLRHQDLHQPYIRIGFDDLQILSSESVLIIKRVVRQRCEGK